MIELAARKYSTSFQQYSLYYICLICSIILLSGCTTLYVLPDDFKEHVQDVFRRQNHATGEMMILMEEDIDPVSYEQLMEAEKKMLMACEPLNEYAVLKRDGLDADLILYQRAMSSAEDCEDSTGQMEALLEKISADDNVGQASVKRPDAP